VTGTNDDPTNDLPPGHPAADDQAVDAGEALTGRSWRAGGAVEDDPDLAPPIDRQPDVRGRPPAEGDVPSPAPPRGADWAEEGAAADVAEFLDVDPPASPATDSDSPAPG
jgi:hypothetical protein